MYPVTVSTVFPHCVDYFTKVIHLLAPTNLDDSDLVQNVPLLLVLMVNSYRRVKDSTYALI